MLLLLRDVRTDGDTQPRLALDEAVVAQMAHDIRHGAQLPALELCLDQWGSYWLVDGFHRVEAYRRVGRVDVEAVVGRGEQRDAFLRALHLNTGRQLTAADRKAAAERLLLDAEWSTWSDREIARRSGVGYMTVARSRAALSAPMGQIAQPEESMAEMGHLLPFRGPVVAAPAAPAAAPKRKAVRKGKAYEMAATPKRKTKKKGTLTGHISIKASSMLKSTPIGDDVNQRRQLARLGHKMQVHVARVIVEGKATTVSEAVEKIAAGAPIDDWSLGYEVLMRLPPGDRRRLCNVILSETPIAEESR